MTETAIAEHGLIGDLQTAALVTTDGSVDWFCHPRFDSPSVFGALLDDERGGRFRIRPAGDWTSTQVYYPDTAVLITRFCGADGIGEVVDFMPPLDTAATTTHRIARLVRCVRGRIAFDVLVAPRFDYGRRPHQAILAGHGAVFVAREMSLVLHVVREPGDEHLAEARVEAGDVHVRLSLSAGQVRGLVLETDAAKPPRDIRLAEFTELFDSTVDWWRGWLAKSTYRGRWREMVARSAITLKLLTYAPTGGLVAAPTLGLPEQIGGSRNWDYRYTWVRDASFSVSALLGIGFTEEAARFGSWLGDRIREGDGAASGPLSVLYRVDGTTDLREESLAHWSGYRGSSPVRIGNDAAGQVQLDIYGEALDSVFAVESAGFGLPHRGWVAVRAVLDWLGEHWDQPEEGIWETRGGRQCFTYGRMMSWVAFDRGIRLARTRGRPAPVEDWTWQRDSIYDQILNRGWHRTRHAFVQHYTGDELDAALLRMPRSGFLPSRDPLWLSTLDAIETDLVTDSLVYRYDPAASPDGLAGDEGTFSLCSFAYVDALARAGRLEDARSAFEKMLTYANHVGLYAEEIAPTGEQLGNFPQAFTHLALIDAAVTLDAALG
ncbi:glycoside hydrolase family 15 protein [Amycolatopsis sp. NPDC049159]|uniref:glycoside hydrolase family 15 protein n=1 Tax=Amycolatopsis sp. NPDC049159 TaxID=3157210 RepID=UPI0033C74A71